MIKFTETDIGCFVKISSKEGELLFIHHFNGASKETLKDFVYFFSISMGYKDELHYQ